MLIFLRGMEEVIERNENPKETVRPMVIYHFNKKG